MRAPKPALKTGNKGPAAGKPILVVLVIFTTDRNVGEWLQPGSLALGPKSVIRRAWASCDIQGQHFGARGLQILVILSMFEPGNLRDT